MRRLAGLLLVIALLLAGCGGDSESTTAADTAATSTDAPATTDSASSGGELTSEDEAAIEDTIRTWLTEGGCELMTDKFLEDQTFIDDPKLACETFESSFSPPAFGPDDFFVDDFQGDATKATAVVSDSATNVESKYTLVNEDGQWRIDSADIS